MWTEKDLSDLAGEEIEFDDTFIEGHYSSYAGLLPAYWCNHSSKEELEVIYVYIRKKK